MYEDFTVPSRLLLLSFAPIRDHEGVIHSGEAVFLVEPLNVRVSVFVPLGGSRQRKSQNSRSIRGYGHRAAGF